MVLGPTLDRCQLEPHFVYVAKMPGEPGAFASCLFEKGYEQFLSEWAAEHMAAGATLELVSCDEAHALLKEYAAWLENERRSDEYHAEHGPR